MKPEQRMWRSLKEKIGGLWDATRHEDLIAKGLADVSFGCQEVNGWIELKCNPEWPVRLDTLVRPASPFTPAQRAWLIRRGVHGGHCFLLWKIGSEWMLFLPIVALSIGKFTQMELRKAAFMRWENLPSAPEFLSAITGLAPERFED